MAQSTVRRLAATKGREIAVRQWTGWWFREPARFWHGLDGVFCSAPASAVVITAAAAEQDHKDHDD